MVLQQGVTLLLINLDGSTTVRVQVSTENAASNGALTIREQRTNFARMSRDSKIDGRTRKEYHLTAKDGDLHSQIMLLNGKVLAVNSSGDIPPLEPIYVSMMDPITVAPFSIVFAELSSAVLPACA